MIGLFAYLIIAGACYYAYRSNCSNYQIDNLEINHQHYNYKIGNNIEFGDRPGNFNGIDIAVDKFLPNIYMDGKATDHFRGPPSYVRAGQRLQLEGDFNEQFNVYAVPGYQVLVLSLLTPDVLETLSAACHDLDVEIYHDHVRLITKKVVLPDTALQQSLLTAAGKLMTEIQHRFASWTPDNERQALTANLLIDGESSYKVLGYSIRSSTFVIGTLYIVFSMFIWLAVILALASNPGLAKLQNLKLIGISLLWFPGLFIVLVSLQHRFIDLRDRLGL